MSIKPRGIEAYNGPKTRLMYELLETFTNRYDPANCDDWAVIELYLARSCRVLENKGWNNGED